MAASTAEPVGEFIDGFNADYARIHKAYEDNFWATKMNLAGNSTDALTESFNALEAFLGEAFLPTPYTSLRLAGAAHDLIGADAVDAEQDNLGPPDMLLGGIAVPDQRREATAARRRNVDGDTGAHPQDSHVRASTGIPDRDSNVRV